VVCILICLALLFIELMHTVGVILRGAGKSVNLMMKQVSQLVDNEVVAYLFVFFDVLFVIV